MTLRSYDCVIAGAGSIGCPTAFYLAKAGFSVLVLDPLPSNGQASNKHAIGGVRATFSDPSKIYLGTNSIRILSSWKENFGDDLEWRSGGYSFPAWDEEGENSLKELLHTQQQLGLNIHWLGREELLERIPDLNSKNLRGGTFSPEDGTASPLKTNVAFYRHACASGVEFRFNERITAVELNGNKVASIRTDKGHYACKYLINAAGAWATELSSMLNLPIPVEPESHEAGITEAVEPMFKAMIVDLRPRLGSNNFYFYQHPTGKIIFCVTPEPPILGIHEADTGDFLPMACRRLIETMPRLANIRIRRTWRGTYPNTPDGNPLLGPVDPCEGYILAAGMSGQGFMLGPGIGLLLSKLLSGTLSLEENNYLHALRYNRDFVSAEKLK